MVAVRDGSEFDGMAAEYDRARPRYPDELVDRGCEGAPDPVLEIGCGTGQLTRSLVARGLTVTAVDRGQELLSLAAQHVGAVDLVYGRFEEVALPTAHFGSVWSAAAFHWLDPDISWAKAADVLRPGGTLCLLQYCGLQTTDTAEDQQLLLATMARVAPEVAATWPPIREVAAIKSGAEARRDNVSEVWSWIGGYELARPASGRRFGHAAVTFSTSVVEQTAEDVIALVRTTSFFPRLSTDQQAAMAREYRAVQDRLGRPIRSALVAVLVTATRT